jgi:hypothetical protein
MKRQMALSKKEDLDDEKRKKNMFLLHKWEIIRQKVRI